MRNFWIFLLLAISTSLLAQKNQPQEQKKLPILDRQNIAEALVAMDQRISLLERENHQLKQEIQQLQAKANNNRVIWLKANQWDNSVYNNSATVVSYHLSLAVPSYVTILGHGHGYPTKSDMPLDVAVFINGELFEPSYREASYGWGTAISHNAGFWIPMITAASKHLPAGIHTIELKMSARGNNTVQFNAPSMLILVINS